MWQKFDVGNNEHSSKVGGESLILTCTLYVQSSVRDSVKLNISLLLPPGTLPHLTHSVLNTMLNTTPTLPPSHYQFNKSYSTICFTNLWRNSKLSWFCPLQNGSPKIFTKINTAKTNKKVSRIMHHWSKTNFRPLWQEGGLGLALFFVWSVKLCNFFL